MTDNQGRPWKHSYIVVKSIKEFAISDTPPGAADPDSASLVLGFLSAPRAFSMDEALGYLRQVSLLIGCHGLNACVLPKFICWKTNPQSNDIRKWDDWKMIRSWGRAHMKGIRALVKEAWNTCSSLLFRDMSWKRPSLTQPCWHPDLGLLASRTVIHNVVYKPPSRWHSVKAVCMH